MSTFSPAGFTGQGDSSVPPCASAVRVLPLPLPPRPCPLPPRPSPSKPQDCEPVSVINNEEQPTVVFSPPTCEPNDPSTVTADTGSDDDLLVGFSESDLPPPPPELLNSDNDYFDDDDDDDDDGIYADVVVMNTTTADTPVEYNLLHEATTNPLIASGSGRYSKLDQSDIPAYSGPSTVPEEEYFYARDPSDGRIGVNDVDNEAVTDHHYDILIPESDWDDENIYDVALEDESVTVYNSVDDENKDSIYTGVAEFTTDRSHVSEDAVCNTEYMTGLSDSGSEDFSGWPTDEFDDEDCVDNTEGGTSFFQGVQNVLNPPYHVLPSPGNATEKECDYIDVNICGTRHPPPHLPPEPPGLTQLQKLRRAIVQQIIDTENSYIRTLQRLRYMYAKPLLEQTPPIISEATVNNIFANIPEILQCHIMVQIALAARVSDWDNNDSIGDVFVASFSKSMVYDVYSKFVTNFTYSMQAIRKATLAKASFQQFLKGREALTADRLSIFCLMVKPIQRFPQLILLVQDLLRNTPKHHADRTHLQLALTELESLAEKLNHVMQESEDKHEVRDIVRCLNVNFSDSFVKPNRYLIRQDDVIQMDLREQEKKRKKSRRLILMNDLLLCVSVSQKPVAVDKKSLIPHRNRALKFNLKFCVPIDNVDIINEELDMSKSTKTNSQESFDINTKSDVVAGNLKRLYDEREDLLHDYNVVGQVIALVDKFKNNYQDINANIANNCAGRIKQMTRAKQHQIRTAVGCTLTISVPGRTSKLRYTFNVNNRDSKLKWQSELELAKLKLAATTKPSWRSDDDDETNKTPALPLFVTSGEIQVTRQSLRMMCAVQSPLSCSPSACDDLDTSVLYGSCQGYLWLCCSEPRMGQISIVSFHSTVPRVVECFTACESPVLVIDVVPGLETTAAAAAGGAFSVSDLGDNLPQAKKNGVSIKEPSVWIGTEWGRVIAYSCGYSSKRVKLLTLTTCRPVIAMKYLNNRLFIGLKDGSLLIYRRTIGGIWKTKEPRTSQLGQTTITALLAVDKTMWCACRNKIHVVSAETEMEEVCFEAHTNSNARVNIMVLSGVGVWISFIGQSVIRLYHTETRESLQEIDISSPIRRMKTTNLKSRNVSFSGCEITCMLITNGRLWVGCAEGIIVVLRLPKLGGIPLISSTGLVSLHGHKGPVRFLTAVSASNMWVKSESCENLAADNRDDMQTPDVELTPRRSYFPPPPPGGAESNDDRTYDDVARTIYDDIVSSIYDNVAGDPTGSIATPVESSTCPPRRESEYTTTTLKQKKYNFSPAVIAEMRVAITKELGQEFFRRKSLVHHPGGSGVESPAESSPDIDTAPVYLDLVPDDLQTSSKEVDDDDDGYEDVGSYCHGSSENVERVQTILPNLATIRKGKTTNPNKQSTLVVSGGEGYTYIQSNDNSKNNYPTLLVWHC